MSTNLTYNYPQSILEYILTMSPTTMLQYLRSRRQYSTENHMLHFDKDREQMIASKYHSKRKRTFEALHQRRKRLLSIEKHLLFFFEQIWNFYSIEQGIHTLQQRATFTSYYHLYTIQLYRTTRGYLLVIKTYVI